MDFGKGDPYNRLRYYTKMGWLPHMIRKKGDESDDVKGHFPAEALNKLLLIEKLKARNLSNDQINKKLNSTVRRDAILSLFNLNQIKKQILTYSIVVVLIIIVAAETGLIKIGKPKDFLSKQIISNTESLTK